MTDGFCQRSVVGVVETGVGAKAERRERHDAREIAEHLAPGALFVAAEVDLFPQFVQGLEPVEVQHRVTEDPPPDGAGPRIPIVVSSRRATPILLAHQFEVGRRQGEGEPGLGGGDRRRLRRGFALAVLQKGCGIKVVSSFRATCGQRPCRR